MTLESMFAHHLPKDAIPATTSAPGEGRNSLGYRCQEFDRLSPINLQVLGCSWAEGVPAHWPQFSHHTCEGLSAYLGVPVGNLNMAQGGSGADFVARTLMCSIDVLKPTAVFIVFPGPERREYLRLDGKLIRYQDDWIREAREDGPHWRQLDPVNKSLIKHMNELRSGYEDSMNLLKNYKLVEGLLNARNIPWGFSFVPHPVNFDIFEYFLTTGWIDKAHFLGAAFEPVDWANEHPGEKSRMLFGQSVFKWFVSVYDNELRAAMARAYPAAAQ